MEIEPVIVALTVFLLLITVVVFVFTAFQVSIILRGMTGTLSSLHPHSDVSSKRNIQVG